jgi:hypothetical protein
MGTVRLKIENFSQSDDDLIDAASVSEGPAPGMTGAT